MELLRLGRVTKFLPRLRGLSLLLRCYRRLLASPSLHEISDFDGDLKLLVDISETIGINLWHAPDLYEINERRVFCSAITPGCTVLDVGANIGIYSLLAAKRGATVFALEADPSNALALRNNVALNGFGKSVTVYEVAASDRAKSLSLYRNPANSGGTSICPNGEPPITIPARSIDSLDLPPIDVCKMDIEGSEASAIEGMQRTLPRSPNMKLLIECNLMSNRDELLSLLRCHFSRVTPVGRSDNLWCEN